MGVEVLVIAIIAGVISLVSAGTSIGTIFHFKRKFKSAEKTESKDTTDITIKNEATKEEHQDGSSTTTRKQEIHITDIDMDMGSKLVSGSTTMTRTGLPNKVAETLASGGTGVLKTLAGGIIPTAAVAEEASDDGSGVLPGLLRGGMKLIEDHQGKGKEEDDDDIDDEVVIHQRKKAKPSIVEVETSDTDDMEDTSDHEDADITERKETTREDSISNLIATVTKETIGGEAVEMLSFTLDDTGVVGEVSSETIDL